MTGRLSAGTVLSVVVDEAAGGRSIALYREGRGLAIAVEHQAEAMARADLLSHDLAGGLVFDITATAGPALMTRD